MYLWLCSAKGSLRCRVHVYALGVRTLSPSYMWTRSGEGMPGLLKSKGRAVEAAREPKARRGRRRAKAMCVKGATIAIPNQFRKLPRELEAPVFTFYTLHPR